MSGDDCIEIDGQNYYLVVGDSFVDLTMPHQNRPENVKQRMTLDKLCVEISQMMPKRHEDCADGQSMA